MSHDVTGMSEMLHDVRDECYIIVMTGRCVNKLGKKDLLVAMKTHSVQTLHNCVNRLIV